MAELETPPRPPRYSRWGLNVLWALPLAIAIGYPIWLGARVGWCGFGGCTGETWASPDLEPGLAIILVVFCAGPIFAAVTIPPWVRPWWIRAIVALLFVLADAYIFGWGDMPGPIPFLPRL